MSTELQLKELIVRSLTFVWDDIDIADCSEDYCTIAVISTKERDLFSSR
jgi:hypothetical protein